MKRILAALLILTTLFLAACSGASSLTPATEPESGSGQAGATREGGERLPRRRRLFRGLRQGGYHAHHGGDV